MLNWAIVGCGIISDLRLAPALSKSGSNRLAAVVSRDEGRAAAFARKHGAEKSFGSLERMLEDPGIDVVYLATPNALHAEQALAASGAGKHVFCEKPMALTIPDCQAMITAARRHGVKLGVAFNNRYNPGHLAARQHLAAGALGEILFVAVRVGMRGQRLDWRRQGDLAGGGALMDLGCHAIDLLRFLTGREVAEVFASLDTTAFGWPLDEVAHVILEFEGGIHGLLGVSQRFPFALNGVEVQGSGGSLLALGTPVSLLRDPVPPASPLEIVDDGDTRRFDFAPRDMFLAEVEAFGNAIAADTEPEISGIEGLRAQEVVEAIQESARTGKAVRPGRQAPAAATNGGAA